MSIKERTLDLSNTLDMIKRLSLFAIPVVNSTSYKNDEDDDEEDDTESYSEDMEKGSETILDSQDMTNDDQATTNKVKYNERLQSFSLDKVEEEEDSDDEYTCQENQFKGYQNLNSCHNPQDCDSSPMMFEQEFQSLCLDPISIKTDYTCSVNNQASPRSQMYEMANELEKYKRENEEILSLYNTLRQENNTLSKSNQCLLDENVSLKNELNHTKQVVDQLQSSSDSKYLDQIDSLRAENKILNQKFTETKLTNAELEAQISKLQKYENIFKKIDVVQINKKLYQIINKIGKGGFSEVFCCISFEEKQSFALKKVDLKDLDLENTKLVLNEIDLLKQLQSTDKVVKLFDYEYLPHKKLLNVLMEIGTCDLGQVFKKEIQKNKCVKEPSRVYFWKKMLEAVQAIHKLGVIHSDLKPSNFLLVNDEVKLIDFNISNSMGDRTSITIMNECGTIEYMSPDIFLKDTNSNGKMNQKVDSWSLGVILYLMCYGKLPLQHVKSYYKKIHSLCDPLMKEFVFDPLEDVNLRDTLSKTLCHETAKRFTVDQLLNHPYILSKI